MVSEITITATHINKIDQHKECYFMDDEISKLVNKEYGPRPSSVTPVPSDDYLRELLIRVADSQTDGLSWQNGVQPQFVKRLETLGYKLRDSNECWNWTANKADNGVRPKFRGRQAYLSTMAAFENSPCVTSSTFDTDHVCGNSLCVRPGPGHAGLNLRSIHQEVGKSDGVRPKRKAAQKPTT
jgi:hypothetical protein